MSWEAWRPRQLMVVGWTLTSAQRGAMLAGGDLGSGPLKRWLKLEPNSKYVATCFVHACAFCTLSLCGFSSNTSYILYFYVRFCATSTKIGHTTSMCMNCILLHMCMDGDANKHLEMKMCNLICTNKLQSWTDSIWYLCTCQQLHAMFIDNEICEESEIAYANGGQPRVGWYHKFNFFRCSFILLSNCMINWKRNFRAKWAMKKG